MARHDWADDEDVDEVLAELPAPQTITNKDGTKTIITYRLNEQGQKVKTTRRIRLTKVREVVNPRVAERKSWTKFGASASDGAGPATDTTSVGENIIFRPSATWRKDAKDESADPNAVAMKDKLKDKKVKCRICNGEHFTARCPYKDTMAPIGETGAGLGSGAEHSDEGIGKIRGETGGLASGAAAKKGSYVPPALRGDRGAGEKMGGSKYGERDDFATLRVTNVSSTSTIGTRIMHLWDYSLTSTNRRCLRWRRRASCVTCLSGLAVSSASSWPRTARRASPRDLPSSATSTATTPSEPATRWTALVSSTSSSESSLPRRHLRNKMVAKVVHGQWIVLGRLKEFRR